MIKNSRILLALAGSAAFFAACSSSDYEAATVTSENVEVTAFSLTADSKILSNLDSVFFSIDLMNARIFNADSLPYGTKVNKLIPKITMSDVSVAELSVRRPGMADTLINYLEHSTDSIDFSNGPVYLRLVSQSGSVERKYQINVNVHNMKSDSLEWGGDAIATMPGMKPGIAVSRTVEFNGKYYTLLFGRGDYSLVCQNNPADVAVSENSMQFGAEMNVESFTATTDACYILDKEGKLYTAADPEVAWTATGKQWHAIVATYADQVIGSAKDAAGNWSLQYYPSGKEQELPAGFPVSGTSQTVSYRFDMSTSTNVLMLGGRKADGSLTNACWSYDGRNWAQLMQRSAMESLEGVCVLPYFTVRTAADWVTNRYSTLVAFGGRNRKGELNRKVYLSYDFGLQWVLADDVMQLPSYVPTTAFSQAFVVDEELKAKSAPLFAPSRISRPITSWECPYIYVYGGFLANGTLNARIWRAVINRFTFKPIE